MSGNNDLAFDDLWNYNMVGHHVLNIECEGYKLLMHKNSNREFAIAHVLIPSGSLIIRPYCETHRTIFNDNRYSNKLRTNELFIDYIVDFQGRYLLPSTMFCSFYDNNFEYERGKTYKHDVDQNINNEYSYGLHFFKTMEEVKIFYRAFISNDM